MSMYTLKSKLVLGQNKKKTKSRKNIIKLLVNNNLDTEKWLLINVFLFKTNNSAPSNQNFSQFLAFF